MLTVFLPPSQKWLIAAKQSVINEEIWMKLLCSLPDEIKMTSISQCYLTDIAMTRLGWVSSARDTHCVFYKALHYTLHKQERPIENQTGYWLICNNKTIHITMQNITGQESEVSNSRPRRWQWREQCAESCLKRKSCVWAAFLWSSGWSSSAGGSSTCWESLGCAVSCQDRTGHAIYGHCLCVWERERERDK